MSKLCRHTAMVGVSWDHSVGSRIPFPSLLTKADSIIQFTQFLILNLCFKVFSFSIWSFQVIVSVTLTGAVWTSLSFSRLHKHICSPPFPLGLHLLTSGPLSLFPSLRLYFPNLPCYPRLKVSMFCVNFWSPSFVGILPTHSIPVPLLFCCLCTFPPKTRKKKMSLEVCVLT